MRSSVLPTVALVIVVAAGCAPTPTSRAGVGQGEPCEVHLDCEEGLSCRGNPGLCDPNGPTYPGYHNGPCLDGGTCARDIYLCVARTLVGAGDAGTVCFDPWTDNESGTVGHICNGPRDAPSCYRPNVCEEDGYVCREPSLDGGVLDAGPGTDAGLLLDGGPRG